MLPEDPPVPPEPEVTTELVPELAPDEPGTELVPFGPTPGPPELLPAVADVVEPELPDWKSSQSNSWSEDVTKFPSFKYFFWSEVIGTAFTS